MTYFLLWIFDVNLLLLYGEEDKAVRRLQEEFIRTTIDIAILPGGYRPRPSGLEDLSPIPYLNTKHT